MKKLFSILTTSVLTLTATISTVACNNNATANKKDNKNEDEEIEQLFKDKVNTFLSTLEFEFKGSERENKLITDPNPNSDFKFLIKGSSKETPSQEQEFSTVTNLTDKIWPNKKNYENDIVEIITAFSVTPPNMPNDYDLEDKVDISMGKELWNYGTKNHLKFFKGNIEIKPKANSSAPKPITLYWKMGYLSKKSYFKALYEQALTYYFGSSSLEGQGTEQVPYEVEQSFEFDENWIKKSISEYIDSDVITKNKKDNKLKEILSNLYKEHSNFLTKDNGDGAEVIPNATWDKDNPKAQWVNFKVIFNNNDLARVDFWLKPKDQN